VIAGITHRIDGQAGVVGVAGKNASAKTGEKLDGHRHGARGGWRGGEGGGGAHISVTLAHLGGHVKAPGT
jgi:hypothetical protein